MKVLVNDFVREFRKLPSPESQRRTVLRLMGPSMPYVVSERLDRTTDTAIACKDIVLISEPQPDGGRAWVMDL